MRYQLVILTPPDRRRFGYDQPQKKRDIAQAEKRSALYGLFAELRLWPDQLAYIYDERYDSIIAQRTGR